MIILLCCIVMCCLIFKQRLPESRSCISYFRMLKMARWFISLSLIKFQFKVRGAKQMTESEGGKKTVCVPLENCIKNSSLHAMCRLILLFFTFAWIFFAGIWSLTTFCWTQRVTVSWQTLACVRRESWMASQPQHSVAHQITLPRRYSISHSHTHTNAQW